MHIETPDTIHQEHAPRRDLFTTVREAQLGRGREILSALGLNGSIVDALAKRKFHLPGSTSPQSSMPSLRLI